jgi:hypothetical protein
MESRRSILEILEFVWRKDGSKNGAKLTKTCFLKMLFNFADEEKFKEKAYLVVFASGRVAVAEQSQQQCLLSALQASPHDCLDWLLQEPQSPRPTSLCPPHHHQPPTHQSFQQTQAALKEDGGVAEQTEMD